MTTQWNFACADMDNLRIYMYAVGDAILANNWLAAKSMCYNAGDTVGLFLGHWWSSTGTTTHRYIRDMFNKINTDWPTGGTVTMSAMLNAMLLAKYDELQYFIGLEDAFRSAIWDQPFNADFYAALARGFRP